MTAPLLVFGWGNASRGDDALGPLFVQRLSALAATAKGNSKMEFLQDYQLQIEHALDLVSRERVLFVDASGMSASRLMPCRLRR
jgi:hydrogenase maturation protease